MSAPFRAFNFSAGPAALPLEVLEEAQKDLLDYKGCGISVMEMSHRGKEFMQIAKEAEQDLRKVMNIPSNYKVLFMQGGATLQFACVPANLLKGAKSADYIVTGVWSEKAVKEAKKFCTVNEIATMKDTKFTVLPKEVKPTADSAYVHYCANETIHGVEFQAPPDVGDKLLVCDMSSDFCSRPVDVSKHAVIYAGAQKNIGPSGITIVIVREDLLGHAPAGTATMMDWKVQADADSMYNTPPCWCLYMCGLVFKWILKKGGLEALEEVNKRKAALLYKTIDESHGFYTCPVEQSCRSRMNAPFRIKGGDKDLEEKFLEMAKKNKMVQLKGHRSVGGLRASIYNACPEESVKALCDFMVEFQKENM